MIKIKYKRFLVYFIVILYILFLFNCKKKNKSTNNDLYVRLPFITSKKPIISIYIDSSYSISVEAKEEMPRIILLVWPDGKIIWSKDNLVGGFPYLEGKISKEKIESFFESLKNKDIFKSSVINFNNSVLDSSFIQITAIQDSNYINMSSWKDVGSLIRNNRVEIYSHQPKEYQEFIRVWKEVREAAKMLIPDNGKPINDIQFEIKSIKIDNLQ